MRKTFAAAAFAAAFAAPALAQDLSETASGAYSLERNHAYLTFAVSHNGLSDYVVNFTEFDADLNFDAERPETSALSVTIDPTKLETTYPDAGKKAEWEDELANDDRWLNADEHPQITFTSTSIELTGENTGAVIGDLTFLGQTKPVTLDVTFNGTANTPWFGERDLIGFNAVTLITRSDWGMDAMLPNIGDQVRVEFSGEFLQDE